MCTWLCFISPIIIGSYFNATEYNYYFIILFTQQQIEAEYWLAYERYVRWQIITAAHSLNKSLSNQIHDRRSPSQREREREKQWIHKCRAFNTLNGNMCRQYVSVCIIFSNAIIINLILSKGDKMWANTKTKKRAVETRRNHQKDM